MQSVSDFVMDLGLQIQYLIHISPVFQTQRPISFSVTYHRKSTFIFEVPAHLCVIICSDFVCSSSFVILVPGKMSLVESGFFFWEGFGVCEKVVWNGRWGGLVCRFYIKDWVFLVDIVCSEVSLSADRYLKRGKKQNMGNSFKGKGKMKKKASFHWFSYGTSCIYRGTLKILINVLKLWGNIDLHNSLVLTVHVGCQHMIDLYVNFYFFLCFNYFIIIVRLVNCC